MSELLEQVDTPIRVLLIEDNPGDVRLVRESLLNNDVPFEVDAATRLQEGIELFSADEHDAILLDLGLPDSQGLETFESLQEATQGAAPVVILSVSGDEDQAVRAVANGAQDYLVKDELPPGALPRAVRYAIERQLAMKGLRTMATDLQTFIGHIAHDLQSPIATVAAMADTLDTMGSDLAGEQLERLVAIARRQSDRMANLVSNLLDLLKVQAEVDVEPVDLEAVVASAVSAVPAPDGFSVDVQVDDLPPVSADPIRAERAVTNLLTNAYRYGKSKVIISGTALGAVVGLSVEDDGEGIPAGYEEDVFAPFHQAPNKTAGGTGLGLAIVRRLARGFGGEVTYEAGEQLGGAKFVLTLPQWRG